MPNIKKTIRIFNFIEGYIRSNGESPTLKEICEHFNFNSAAAAHLHVQRMIQRGWIKCIPHISRGIRLTGNGPKPLPKILCPICTEELEETEFGICRARKSGRNLYCKSCIRAKVSVHRASVRAMKAAQGRLNSVGRKPNTIAKTRCALSLVYNAVIAGKRTREEIHRTTRLSYDDIGLALCELLEAKGIVIHNREYVPIEEVLVRSVAA